MLKFAAVIVFAGAMVWAAVSDAKRFEVPNRVPAIVVLAYPLFALGSGAGWDVGLSHLIACGAVLVAGFLLFLVRVMGAGDAKLLAAASLWLGWPAVVPYLVVVALAGGVLAGLLVLFRRRRLSDRIGAIGWVRQLHERKKDIPYAIAISFAALFMLPDLLR